MILQLLSNAFILCFKACPQVYYMLAFSLACRFQFQILWLIIHQTMVIMYIKAYTV